MITIDLNDFVLYSKKELINEPNGTHVFMKIYVQWWEGKYLGLDEVFKAIIDGNNTTQRDLLGCNFKVIDGVEPFKNIFVSYSSFDNKMKVNHYDNQKIEIYKKLIKKIKISNYK